MVILTCPAKGDHRGIFSSTNSLFYGRIPYLMSVDIKSVHPPGFVRGKLSLDRVCGAFSNTEVRPLKNVEVRPLIDCTTYILLLNFHSNYAWIAQLAERKHGKFEARGSIPRPGSYLNKYAGMPEWTNGRVCKTRGASLRRFESSSQHTSTRYTRSARFHQLLPENLTVIQYQNCGKTC